MSSFLSDEKVFIVGGGISVGRACIDLFQQQGAQVAFLDIMPERVNATVKATNALGYTVDIGGGRDKVVAAIDDAADRMGGLTALVNIASEMHGGRVVDTNEKHIDRMVDVNIKGYYWTTQASIPHMLQSGKGSIVHFGSVAATHPGYAESYGFAKAAQLALSYQLAMEHAPAIRSNAILCGWIADSHQSRLLQQIPELFEPIVADHPMGRAATSAELANVCLFLASDMSMAVNGATLIADGGQTRTQGNLNQLMSGLGEAFARNPELLERLTRMNTAITREELLSL